MDNEVGVGDAERLAESRSPRAVNLFFSRAVWESLLATKKTPPSALLLTTKMPPSQLKQLKASLRESGVVGPQQSKKQKRQNAKTGVGAQNRNQRNAALQAIRDRFNPFEIRPTATRSKFETTTRDDNSKKTATGRRPGVTKSLGEERVSLLLSG